MLAEYGIAIPKGITYIHSELPRILGENPYDIGGLMLGCLTELYNRFCYLDKKIDAYTKKIEGLFKNNEECQRLEKIPGIGILGATMLASILGNGGGFKNGRHFAAFLGLTPRQYSSGGKERLLGISKGGDTYIRTLLIHGARSVLLCVDKKDDKQSTWLKNLMIRAGHNKTAVALANKIARTAWAIIAEGTNYSANYEPVFLKTA